VQDNYPIVLGEFETLRIALSGRSLSRVGEGELRIATGIRIKSQCYDDRLATEMRGVLAYKSPNCLVCLPRIWAGMPAEKFWRKFERHHYSRLYRLPEYGSAFVSRPDMVNTIDCPEYWDMCAQLWRNLDVVLVSRSRKVVDLASAASVRFVECPSVDAYAKIDKIEEEIGKPSGPIIIALGATATVLAVRLSKRNLYALDIGHLGRFMVTAGAYSVDRQNLISDEYIRQNAIMHRRPEGYGGSGYKRRDEVAEYAKEVGAAIILDYGCGQGTLKKSLAEIGVVDIVEYDPAIKGKQGLPKPAELVVCTDVLEHVEPEKLAAVLEHLYRLTLKAAFFVIAMRKANKILPDKRNAHLIIKPVEFWIPVVEKAGFVVVRQEAATGKELKLWLVKRDGV